MDSQASGSQSSPPKEAAGNKDSPTVTIEKLKASGNAQYGQGKYESAIQSYSQAISLAKSLGSDSSEDLLATLFSNRSAAFSSQCRLYLSRPAARSESAALYGLDPGHLAALALADAHQAIKIKPNWPKAYSRLGTALFLSERYFEAEQAYLSGLSMEPDNKFLQDGLKEVAQVLQTDDDDAAPADSTATSAQVTKRPRTQRRGRLTAALDDCECTLCLKLLYEPVTTACGHTFCRSCFVRVMDHSPKCPICRTILHSGPDTLPISITLAAIIAKSFPEEYAERGAEEAELRLAAAAVPGAEGEAGAIIPSLPLFVMSTLFPGETMKLNIFEPRYRLLIRRAMEGNRRIGMAQVRSRGGELESVVVEAECIECTAQPDGRFHIEVVGRRRVEVLETRELDGYRVARGRVLTDEPPAEAEAAQLTELCTQVGQAMDSWLNRLRGWLDGPGGRGVRGAHMREMLDSFGPTPPYSKPEAFSFWVAALALSFIHTLDHADRTQMLSMKSTRERLTLLQQHLSNTGNPEQITCSVM